MRYAVFAQSFVGAARIGCRRCGNTVVFSDNAKVILWDDGVRLFVVDAKSRQVVHRCGRKLEWVCIKCKHVYQPKEIPYIRRRKRQSVPDTRCQNCFGGKLIQREMADRSQEDQ